MVRNALVALSSAYHGEVLRFAGRMLDGLFRVYASEESQRGTFDPDLFVDVLAGTTQEEWVRDAEMVARESGLSRREAMTKVMWDAYREAADEANADDGEMAA